MTTSALHPFRAAAFAAVAIAAVALLAPGRAAAAYGWPVKPFDAQHPIRAYFGDPRIGHGEHALHFGIDVVAKNGTPVYAVTSGTISQDPRHPEAILVTSGSVVYEYWHVVAARTSGYATAFRTVLGTVEAPWAHVHFAERHNSTYVNPLRRGALRPYRDTTLPTIRSIGVDHGRVVVDAYDTTPLRVFPAWWAGKPVSPALVEWRVGGGTGRGAGDCRNVLGSSYAAVYGETTRQNLASVTGRYRFVLGSGSGFSGAHAIQVRVADTAGNAAVASFSRASRGWRRIESSI